MSQAFNSYAELCLHIKSLIILISNLPDTTPVDIDDDMALFGHGLGLDSIDVLELVVNLEKQYGIKIRNDEYGHKALSNVSTIAQEIMKHKGLTLDA